MYSTAYALKFGKLNDFEWIFRLGRQLHVAFFKCAHFSDSNSIFQSICSVAWPRHAQHSLKYQYYAVSEKNGSGKIVVFFSQSTQLANDSAL